MGNSEERIEFPRGRKKKEIKHIEIWHYIRTKLFEITSDFHKI